MKLGEKQLHFRSRLASVFTLAVVSLVAPACEDLGFQGGVIPNPFGGLRSIEAISPESIQLVWDPYPGATEYKVYVPELNDAVAKPSFTTLITPPRGNPKDDGSYSFSVTATDPTSGTEQGLRSNYLSVKLLPRFNFSNGSVTSLSASAPVPGIRVTWPSYPLVNYRVFVSERTPAGSVNYNFSTSTASVVGTGTVDITGLQAGREYCAVVIASYLDGTSDAPNGSKIVGSLNNLLVGPGGGFGGSVVAQGQKCYRTAASVGFGNVVNQTNFFVPKGVPSNYPTFYVNILQDTSEDGSGPARVAVYRVDPVTNLGTLLGSRIGTGSITSTIPLTAGRYKFFGIIEDLAAGSSAQSKKEIIVGPKLTPAAEADRPWVFVRGLQDSDAVYGNYPEQQQGGRGSVKMGSSVAMGDFNCDGRSDLAVGIPEVSETLSDNRTAKLGRVMIYYDVREPSAVSSCTRSQSLVFDISDQYPSGRDLRLGTSLFVGNFNQDNQKTNNPPQFPGTQVAAFKCDDLVIGSGYGPMFVLYGKRDTVEPETACTTTNGSLPSPRPDGGLNYLGPKSFVTNPSAACAPSTGTCQPSMYTFQSPTLKLGTATTSGDFDGDGYPDLAASTGTGSTGVWVLRGSEYGLIAPNAFSDTTSGEVIQSTSGPGRLNFPYIPANSASFSEQVSNPTNHILKPTSIGWASGSFGASLGVIRNAYYDYLSPTAPTTKRMRDVLLIGAPDYAHADGRSGRVFACIPKTMTFNGTITTGATFSDDSATNLAWDCSHFIDPPQQYGSPAVALAPRRFGAAMASFKNALRYRPTNFDNYPGCELTGNSAKAEIDFANCTSTGDRLGYPGAMAIGASESNQVFVYYGVNFPDAASIADRDQRGSARNVYLSTLVYRSAAVPTTISATIGDACVNNNGTSESCQIQLITQASSPGGRFGTVMAAFTGNNVEDATTSPRESTLAVAAPYKTIVIGSSSYANVGSVQLFQQKSNFSNDPITVNGVSRYSTGFSRTLTSTIDYDGPINDQIFFGLGGIAAGPLESVPGGTSYSSNSDVVIGAPGHVRNKDANGVTIPNVFDNGAASILFSHGGTLRNYRIGGSPSVNSTWHLVDSAVSSDGLATPVGQESDIRFHQGISIGDIDQDGVGDVAVRIARGTSRNTIRIYPGANCTDLSGVTCSVRLKKSLNQYTNFNVPGDSSAGYRFVPAGPLRGGTYNSFFITGSNDSYLFFGGTTGIIMGVPSNVGAPRRLGAGTGSLSGGATYLPFGNSSFYHAEGSALDSTLNTYAPFASGDFNGDGFIDFAFGHNSTTTEGAGVVDSANSANKYLRTTLAGTFTGRGRVYILYGGAENGFQIQPDPQGGYPLVTQYSAMDGKPYGFSTFSKGSAAQTNGVPCTQSAGVWTCSKAQVLGENSTVVFGSTVTAVPMGLCGNYPVHGLAVRAEFSNSSSVYIYKPKCLGTANDLSGINDAIVIKSSDFAINTSKTLGVAMVGATNLMGVSTPTGLTSHLVVTEQDNRRIFAIPFVTDNGGSVVMPTTASVTTGNALIVDGPRFSTLGGRTLNYSTASFLNGVSGATAGMGDGSASLGDMNGDGFEDVGINFSKLNRVETNELILNQGGALVLFGGETGLQTHNGTVQLSPSAKAECYQKSVNNAPKSVCNPLLYFAPQPAGSLRKGAYEFSFLSPHSRVSTGNVSATGACLLDSSPNQCLGSFLFGVPGRDSIETPPTRPVLQGGVFYVVP